MIIISLYHHFVSVSKGPRKVVVGLGCLAGFGSAPAIPPPLSGAPRELVLETWGREALLRVDVFRVLCPCCTF